MPIKANKPPRLINVPVVLSVFLTTTALIFLATSFVQGRLIIDTWVFVFTVAAAAILAIPIVLSNGISYFRVLQEEQNDLLRELTREQPAKLQLVEAQLFASYVAAIDLKTRLNAVDSDSPVQRESVAELQAAIGRIAERMEPLSTQVDHELQKAKTDTLRNRLLLAIEFIRQQLKPYPAHTLGHMKSNWQSSQVACERAAQRLEAVRQSAAWDERLKTALGFEQLHSIQQQFAQLGDWPQGPAPGVVDESGAPAGTGLYEYAKALKEAEKSLDRWRRQLEGDTELDE